METQQYSLTRFWRYIFTPLLLIALGFGWYVIFTLPSVQLAPILSPFSSIPTATIVSANVGASK
jgi:hypothetical protein